MRGYERSRREFQADAGSANELLKVGDARHDVKLDAAELAELTTVASTLLWMDEAIIKQ